MIDRANFERIKRRIKILAAEGKIAPAQAIEAQRAGTTKIGPVADESAVAESDAPKGATR